MKNKHTKFRLIGAGIAAVGIILLIIGFAVKVTVLDVIGIVIGAFGGIFYAIATTESRKFCDKCGASMKGCAWEYSTVSSERKYNEQTHEAHDHYVIQIRAKCPECGCVKEYNAKFVCKSNENIQNKIDNYMRAKFGDRL